MKKNLLLITLSLLASQACFGMDNNNNKRSVSETGGNSNAKKYKADNDNDQKFNDPNGINNYADFLALLTIPNQQQPNNPHANEAMPIGPHMSLNFQQNNNNNRVLSCDYLGCNYKTTSDRDFMAHKAIHADEQPFPCDYPRCTYQTKYKSCLTGHMLEHAGQKHFVCDHTDCTYKTTQKKALAMHKKIKRSSNSYDNNNNNAE